MVVFRRVWSRTRMLIAPVSNARNLRRRLNRNPGTPHIATFYDGPRDALGEAEVFDPVRLSSRWQRTLTMLLAVGGKRWRGSRHRG